MIIIVSFTVAFLHLPKLCLNETRHLNPGPLGEKGAFFFTSTTPCCRKLECGEQQTALSAVAGAFLAACLALRDVTGGGKPASGEDFLKSRG